MRKESLIKLALEKYDMESDMVVLGYGGAGAIAAHDKGAKVINFGKTKYKTFSQGGTWITPLNYWPIMPFR